MFRKKALFSDEDETESKDQEFIESLPTWVGPKIYTEEDEKEDFENFEKSIEPMEVR